VLRIKVALYSKQWEVADTHEIIVGARADPRSGGLTVLVLDKLVFTVDNGSDPSTTPNPTNSQVPTSPTTSQGNSTSSKTTIGAIVGGTIGGTILLISTIILLCRRKKRRAQKVEKNNLVNPYMMDISIPTPLLNKESLAMGLQQPERMDDEEPRPVVTLTTGTRAVARREQDGGSIHGISEFGIGSAGTLPPDYEDLVELRQS